MTVKCPLDPTQRSLMVMPDGTVVKTLVNLNQAIDHPRTAGHREVPPNRPWGMIAGGISAENIRSRFD
ncbi:MAG: hypothetical protein K9H25_02305 [Rhodospirillum sp.]|nr:hypothetical protein [Rhodospirillum sp.]MCF8487961.1 hypothetical protein [Rhodospirillum sp.]MCF8499308.1 hypothetical protein [Rhodospirillum sp.]